MSKFPTSEKTEIFTMRVTPSLKQKIKELSKKSKYGGSLSSTIRYLIESAYKS
jgi:hypothetical protein